MTTDKKSAGTQSPTGGIPPELQEAEGWRPDPGNVIEGTIVRFSSGFSDYTGDTYPIITLRLTDGSYKMVHAFQTALRRELITAAPKIGEEVGIAYHGKRDHKSKKGQSVAYYTVNVKGRDGDGSDFWATFNPAPVETPSGPVEADTTDIPF